MALPDVFASRIPLRTDESGRFRILMLSDMHYAPDRDARTLRLVSELDNVRNPKSRPDIPQELLSDGQSGLIRLSSFAQRLMEGANGPEPAVPFHVYDDYTRFQAEGDFDFVTVAISPRYAPKEADALLDVLSEYIRKE